MLCKCSWKSGKEISMIKEIAICDKCGKEMNPYTAIHLCDECYKEFMRIYLHENV